MTNHLKSLLGFLLLFTLSGCLQPPVEVGDDPMAARTLENKQVHNPSELPAVAVVTPAHGWWSGSQNLGAEVPFAPDSQNRQTILRLPEIGHPEIWTISLYLTKELKELNSFDVQAVIEFGAGGSTQIVKIDWTNGAQISLPMNAVNVMAEFRHVDVTVGDSGIRLGVQVAKGRRGGNQPPRSTMVSTIFLAPLARTAFIEIPAFASNIKVVSTQEGGSDEPFLSTVFYTIFSGDAGGAFNVQSLNGQQLFQAGGLQVFGAGRFIQVFNANPGYLNFGIYADIFG